MWYFVERNGKCVKACKRLESACSRARKFVCSGSRVRVLDSCGNRYSIRTGRLM